MGDFRDTLYTVDKEGKRKWVYPEIVIGFWVKRRAVVAYVLMAFYLLMPWITIGGKQGVRFDIPHRHFTFFSFEFWATDGFLLFLVFGMLTFSLFLFTSLLGRVWCGWACPETVFLEFLYRPIERLTLGKATKRKRLESNPWTTEKIIRKFAQHTLSAVAAWVIASSALAYFIGREPLLQMMSDWPQNNPTPFALTLGMMGLMAFQFGWFREQFCTVLCPYARFQSVLMDSQSIIVGYDIVRGEPRGKVREKKQGSEGDCVDCGLCVRVCPTGIDIRNGLQLECVACTACVDACDSIMEKVGSAPGLIRYDTEDRLLGKDKKRSILRTRPFVYFAILLAFAGTFVVSLSLRQNAEFQIVRGRVASTPYSVLPDGRISNQLQLILLNKADSPQSFSLRVEPADSATLVLPQNPVTVAGRTHKTLPLFVNFEASLLKQKKGKIIIFAEGSNGFKGHQPFSLLGPDY